MLRADPFAARETTRRAAQTFFLASRLLPREVRGDVYLLYLVFRTLDDAVDEHKPEADEQLAAVEAWAADGTVEGREAQLLEELSHRHPLPRTPFADFCAGLRHDLERTTVEDEDQLERYCYQVAGTVGVVMGHVLGMDDPERAVVAAAALGAAMQRTNVLRDIDEDLREGRVYIPATMIERFGGSLAPGCRAELLREQILIADAQYDIGCAGISLLQRGRGAIRAAAGMYREILRQIERDGYGAHAGRSVVTRRRKLVVAARSR